MKVKADLEKKAALEPESESIWSVVHETGQETPQTTSEREKERKRKPAAKEAGRVRRSQPAAKEAQRVRRSQPAGKEADRKQHILMNMAIREARLARHAASASLVVGMSVAEMWRRGIKAAQGMFNLLMMLQPKKNEALVYSGITHESRFGGSLPGDFERVTYDEGYGGAQALKDSHGPRQYEELDHFRSRGDTVRNAGANGMPLSWLKVNASVFACERGPHVSRSLSLAGPHRSSTRPRAEPGPTIRMQSQGPTAMPTARHPVPAPRPDNTQIKFSFYTRRLPNSVVLKIAEIVLHTLLFRHCRSFVYDALLPDFKGFLNCEHLISAGKVGIEGRGYIFFVILDSPYQHMFGALAPKWAWKQSLGQRKPTDVNFLEMQKRQVEVADSSSWLRSASAPSLITVSLVSIAIGSHRLLYTCPPYKPRASPSHTPSF